MTIAAVMMVKNESQRVHVTVNSVQDHLDAIVVFDTGSDDGTPDLIKQLSKIPVHVKHGTFTHFGQAYSEMLDFADECADEFGYTHFVILDANDEFVGKRPTIQNPECSAWYIERRWKHGPNDITSLWNHKLVKAKTGSRYVGVVHEYLNVIGETGGRNTDFYIFQDRCMDGGRSQQRFFRDRGLLEKEHEEDPTNQRVLFYLAQTYSCIGEYEKAYEHYEKRTKIEGGYEEERWFSMLKCGELATTLNKNWEVSLGWYLKAYCKQARAEPLVLLADHYRLTGDYKLSYAFAKMACEISFPTHCMLFIETKCYDYTRWHILGIVAYYAARNDDGTLDKAKLKIGEDACEKAICVGYNLELDTKNLEFYLTV